VKGKLQPIAAEKQRRVPSAEKGAGECVGA
jgi:hypothetical protein